MAPVAFTHSTPECPPFARCVSQRRYSPKTASGSTEVKKLLAQNLLAIGYIEDTQVDPSVRVLREN